MFRLDNLLEQWATIYQPMQHNPAATAKPDERAFFRIDRMELENGFTRAFNLLRKPCLCHAVNIEARLNGNNPRLAEYHHQLYFCQKQDSPQNPLQDEMGATDAKLSLDDMVLDLLGFLFAAQDHLAGRHLPKDTPDSVRQLLATLDADTQRGIRGLRLDDTEWWSTPRYKTSWWIMGVELYGIDTTQLCIRPTRYV